MNFCIRTLFYLFGILTFFGSCTALAEVAIQYRCAGGLQLAAEAQLTTLHKVLASRWTTNLENIILTKVSSLLTNNGRFGTNPLAGSLLEPLLSDCVKTETMGSFAGVSNKSLSFVLVLRLETQQVQRWQATFNMLFGGSGDELAIQGFDGRRWKMDGSNSLWMIHAQDWLMVGCGDDFSADQVEYLKQIKAQGRPFPALKDHWLEADLTSAELGGWFRLLKPARLRITVTPNEDDMHVDAKLNEAVGAGWNFEPWQIPKELVGGQIISFVAGQDVTAFLNIDPALANAAIDPLAHQFYFWALEGMPFLNYIAWPVTNASNALERFSIQIPAVLNPELKRFNGTELIWHSKAGKLAWQNMRLFVPALEAVETNGHQFLFASSFPKPPNGNPISNDLLAQIEGRTNLVYYDWELTGPRLGEWLILNRMIFNRLIGENKDGKNTMFIESQWLGALSHILGNSTTEITSLAPNELSIERKAPLGLTAVELVLLANWVCGVNSDSVPSPSRDQDLLPLPVHH